ncbi:uncharacterized protein LOC127751124 [Frankliniella occidentalis]|uniref:Uncharacterized protein LOC127751124 n=1 Tax=Frankliniella occidentalis TaxID=133901 RepID=A0A9C6XTQ4_FRAOC|nr:uncharacterized protein LOC127751124 [Frankliniella occidentalis]
MHCDAKSLFRKYTKEADLRLPQFVRSRNLRTHVGTMTQLLNLGPDGLKKVSKFMGHSDAIHDLSSELPEDTMLLAKFSKLLFAFQKGVAEFKGKSLDEIEIDADTLADEESDTDPDIMDSEKTENVQEKASTSNSQDADDEEPQSERKVNKPKSRKRKAQEIMTVSGEKHRKYSKGKDIQAVLLTF